MHPLDPSDPQDSAATRAWLPDALARLAARRRERIGVLEGAPMHAIAHLLHAAGRDGTVDVLPAEPRAWPTGRYDAVWVGWTTPTAGNPALGIDLARTALRPGGRLVIDLPALRWSDDLEALRPLLGELGVAPVPGLDLEPLQQALVAAGLRDVRVTARTCVADLPDAHELVDLALADAPPGVDGAALHLLALRQLAGRTAPVASVFRRIQGLARR